MLGVFVGFPNEHFKCVAQSEGLLSEPGRGRVLVHVGSEKIWVFKRNRNRKSHRNGASAGVWDSRCRTQQYELFCFVVLWVLIRKQHFYLQRRATLAYVRGRLSFELRKQMCQV